MSVKIVIKSYYVVLIGFFIVKMCTGQSQPDHKDRPKNFTIYFNLTMTNDGTHCTRDGTKNKTLSAQVGSVITIGTYSNFHVNLFNCRLGAGGRHRRNNGVTGNFGNVNILIDNSDMNGEWLCVFYTLRDNQDLNLNKVTINGTTYVETKCQFHVTVEELRKNALAATLETNPDIWIYVGIGGLCLFTVIIVQMGVIIYFKLKAQRVTRLETLSLRVRNSENNDNKRYSTTPSRRSRITKFFTKSHREESRIYETLDEIQNYSQAASTPPPTETIPTLKKKKKEIDLKNRPPLPLPQDVSDDEATDSQIEKIRNQVNVQKEANMAPPILPKTVTPKDLIPKPLGILNAKVQGSAIVTSELDTIFKKRQNSATKPTVPENLIPKKAIPPPTPALKPVLLPQKMPKADSTSTLKQKPLPAKPSPKLLPVSQVPSKPTPQLPPIPQGLSKPPPQLPPMPQGLSKPPPQLPPMPQVPVKPTAQLPPIPQESIYEEYEEEQLYNGDEWTYEALPQTAEYNLYSM